MIQTLWNSSVAWFGIGGSLVLAAAAVAYFFPPFRKQAIAVGAGILGVLAIYGKGAADAKRKDRERRDAAANKIQDKYREIDARPVDDKSVIDDMRNGKY